MKELNDFIRVRKTINGLMFCQAITILLGPILSDMSSRPRVAVMVRRLGVPPSAGITYTSVLPSYCDVNAICEPPGKICAETVIIEIRPDAIKYRKTEKRESMFIRKR